MSDKMTINILQRPCKHDLLSSDEYKLEHASNAIDVTESQNT